MAARGKNTNGLKVSDIPSKLLSGFLNTPATILLNKLMYVILLASFLIIGFLLGKVQTLEKNPNSTKESVSASAPTQSVSTDPLPTLPPNPKEILKKLGKGHLPPEGNENAKVTIIEFSDFQCPFCASFFKDTLPKIRADYVETGKIKIYYRHLPLTFHPQAKPLAIASECANDQGMFWQMHDKIFENSAGIGETTVENHKVWAQELGLNTVQFNTCVDNQNHVDLIDEDATAAGEVGITGTPGFFINGRLLMGAQPYSVFKATIDEELAK